MANPLVKYYGDSAYKYGNTIRYYGSQSLLPGLSWIFEVDWNNDGVYDGNLTGKILSIHTKRGRQFMMKADGSGFEPMMVGNMTVVLDNTDQKYNPYNTSSPLYPNVLPGRLFRLRVRNGPGGTVYNVIAGNLG